MTFREFMAENNYELLTTFWDDFSIADRFGVSGILLTGLLRSGKRTISILRNSYWCSTTKYGSIMKNGRNWWHFINPFGSRPTGTPWSICKATS